MQIWVLALIEKHWAKKGLLAHNDNHCTLLVFTIFSPILLIKWWHLIIGPRWNLIMCVCVFFSCLKILNFTQNHTQIDFGQELKGWAPKKMEYCTFWNSFLLWILTVSTIQLWKYKSIINAVVPEIFYIGYTVP